MAQPKRLALLACLAAATPFGFHRRDKLVALFWPETDISHARASLRLHAADSRAAASAAFPDPFQPFP